jgi:hypothetical protein
MSHVMTTVVRRQRAVRLREEIAGCNALIGYHTAMGNLAIAANFQARRDEYAAELAEVEGR